MQMGQLSQEGVKNFTVVLQSPNVALQLLQMTGQVKPAFNVVISNYPGPREPLYLNGAKMEAIYPCAFIFGGQGLNITLTSYVDQLHFGLVACRDGVPDIQHFASLLIESFEELTRASGV